MNEQINCCALCSMFSCSCGPEAPCQIELRNPKPMNIPKRADGKNAFHVPVEFKKQPEGGL